MNLGDFAIGVNEGLQPAIRNIAGMQAIRANQVQMEREEAEAPTRMKILGNQLAVGEQNLAVGSQNLAISKQTAALNEIKVKEAQEKYRIGRTPITVSALAAQYAPGLDLKSPEGQKVLEFVSPFLEDTDVAGGEKFVRQSNLPEIGKMLQVPSVARTVGEKRIESLDSKISALEGEIGKISEKATDPAKPNKQLQSLQASLNQTRLARQNLFAQVQGMSDQLKEMEKEYGVAQTTQFFNGEKDLKDLVPLKQQEIAATAANRVPRITTKDLGDRVETYTDGVLTKTEPKGIAPAKSKLLTPAEEAQQIRISKAKNEEMGASKIPNIPDGGIPGQLNKEALQGATAGEQAIVKQLVEYKMPLPSGFALKSPYWQNIMQRAALYDPSFDASQYNVRLKLRNDFNTGKAGQNIRSLNTAVAHLGELDKAAKDLSNGSVQLWNRIANYGLTQSGDSRVTKFNAAATAVEGELANVFKNTGATDQEIKAWRQNLDSMQSPKQLKDNIQTVISLLGGRLGALQNQYETGMGKPKDFKFLSEKSRSILKGIGTNVEELDPTASRAVDKTNVPADYKVGSLYQGKKIIGINRDTKQINVEGLGVVSY